MVIALGPGKFYGSSLPRPRIYTDIKYSTHRVDPPVSVVDPLLSWAHEAHWSMGGLSHKRLRLQGRIEGNISKLRKDNDKLQKARSEKFNASTRSVSESPPPAPDAKGKRKRRFMALIDEEEEEEEEEEEPVVEEEEVARVVEKKRKKPARKLIDEFDSVAAEKVTSASTETESVGRRTSPRSGSKTSEAEKTVVLKSVGGSFVSKMQKASQALIQMRRSGASSIFQPKTGLPSGRTSPRLVKMKT